MRTFFYLSSVAWEAYEKWEAMNGICCAALANANKMALETGNQDQCQNKILATGLSGPISL